MNLLTVAPRLGLRALEDLHQIALAARDIGPRLGTLQDRADSIEEQLGEAILIARQIEERGREAIEMAGRIDTRAQAILDLADRVDDRAAEIMAEAKVIQLTAAEVAVRGGQVADALPLLQRALEIAEPLESTVERLGRLIDRLPGGVRGGGRTARPPR